MFWVFYSGFHILDETGRRYITAERSTQVTHLGKSKKWCQGLLCSCMLWKTMGHREGIGCGYQWTSGNGLESLEMELATPEVQPGAKDSPMHIILFEIKSDSLRKPSLLGSCFLKSWYAWLLKIQILPFQFTVQLLFKKRNLYFIFHYLKVSCIYATHIDYIYPPSFSLLLSLGGFLFLNFISLSKYVYISIYVYTHNTLIPSSAAHMPMGVGLSTGA